MQRLQDRWKRMADLLKPLQMPISVTLIKPFTERAKRKGSLPASRPNDFKPLPYIKSYRKRSEVSRSKFKALSRQYTVNYDVRSINKKRFSVSDNLTRAEHSPKINDYVMKQKLMERLKNIVENKPFKSKIAKKNRRYSRIENTQKLEKSLHTKYRLSVVRKAQTMKPKPEGVTARSEGTRNMSPHKYKVNTFIKDCADVTQEFDTTTKNHKEVVNELNQNIKRMQTVICDDLNQLNVLTTESILAELGQTKKVQIDRIRIREYFGLSARHKNSGH